jgi:hypothetical protein
MDPEIVSLDGCSIVNPRKGWRHLLRTGACPVAYSIREVDLFEEASRCGHWESNVDRRILIPLEQDVPSVEDDGFDVCSHAMINGIFL